MFSQSLIPRTPKNFVMALAKGNHSDHSCSCYKVLGLADPILETPHISYLEDRYVLGDQLGWGQFGIIRACTDMVTGEILACKSIAKDRLVSADDLRGVKLEIEVMAQLSGHPNVVDLKAVYEDECFVHLVMELCAGGELFHRLEKHGCFSEPEAAVLFRQIMEVVMYCHDKGVVHRDLKPENILLATKSSSSPIKLADFGLATYIKPGQSLFGTVGSPFYIAPEVLAGGYNQAADVWSAGVILYILLSGMPPFWGKTKSRIFDSVRSAELRFPCDPWDAVSESAKDLVAGMLQRDPSQRLTAKQVLEHSWIKDFAQQSQCPNGHGSAINIGQQDLVSCSFSTRLLPPSRDVSFGFASPVSCHQTQPSPASPTFTCQTSFSTYHVEPTTPTSATIAFAFQSLDLSSPVPLIPSFSFVSSSPSNEQESLKASTLRRDSSIGELFVSPEPEHNEAEHKRGVATTSRTITIRRKRNHTIGLGEFEQLDLMVSESVIRWASCTHLPSAPSLRSSLVC